MGFSREGGGEGGGGGGRGYGYRSHNPLGCSGQGLEQEENEMSMIPPFEEGASQLAPKKGSLNTKFRNFADISTRCSSLLQGKSEVNVS